MLKSENWCYMVDFKVKVKEETFQSKMQIVAVNYYDCIAKLEKWAEHHGYIIEQSGIKLINSFPLWE